APDDNGLERQRARAQPRDHGLAAGLDALGNRDLAFAREQLDRAHLAQVHPDRIVGALCRFGFFHLGRPDDLLAAGLLLRGFLTRVLILFRLGFLRFDDIDAHFIEHRQNVLDLLRGNALRVQQLLGDVAALFGEVDYFLDAGIRSVENRPIRRLGYLLFRHLVGFRVCYAPRTLVLARPVRL